MDAYNELMNKDEEETQEVQEKSVQEEKPQVESTDELMNLLSQLKEGQL